MGLILLGCVADEVELAPTVSGADVSTLIEWEPCGRDLDCGQVAVPLDHDRSRGRKIEISLVRVEATGDARGSIFVNPGGPGASGIDFVAGGFRLDDETAAQYSLVGFDPRGIGDSEPLTCMLDRSGGRLADLSPDNPDEAALLDEEASAFAAECEDLDSLLLPYVNTDSVVRDLDLLRQAVGDDELHYLGFSYGSLLGLVYAERFPDRVGHVVLDGVVDPTLSLAQLLTQQTEAFNKAFLVLDEACDGLSDCPSGGIVANHDALVERLERTAPTGEVGATELETAALISLYSDSLWPRYARALGRGLDGDYEDLLALSDLFVSSVSFASYAAVICTDGPHPQGAAQWSAFAQDLAASYPRFGATIANELRPCAFWPIEPRTAREPVIAAGAGPILVIGTTNDPATPVTNALNVADTLHDGRLIVFDGDRHTAYQASSCVRELVRDYFVSDTAPSTTARCRN